MPTEPAPLINCHTHQLSDGDSIQILSLHLTDTPPPSLRPRQALSWGLHPWYSADLDPEVALTELCEKLRAPEVVALGEAGLDRFSATDYTLQKRLFREQIALSEALQLPLIIHLVRAVDDILALRRTLRPSQPWIIHGFRGKPQQAQQLLRHGLYLSFGLRHQSESLRLAYTAGHALLETDDERASLITEIYHSASQELAIPEEELRTELYDLIRRLFPRLSPLL